MNERMENEKIVKLLKSQFPNYNYTTIVLLSIWLNYISDYCVNIRYTESISTLIEHEYKAIEQIFKNTEIIQRVFFGINTQINYNCVAFDNISQLITSNNKLGSGTYGTVYSGTFNNKNVAIKKFTDIKKNNIADQYSDWCVFMKEYALLSKLQDTGVVGKLYGAGWDSMNWIMIMERHRINSINWKINPINTIQNTTELIYDLFNAIHSIHQITGRIHGDIKPDNIMIDIVENKPIVKIIDFGLAEIKNKTNIPHEYIQTIYWRAPELLQHKSCDLILTDIWATAISAIDILSGCYVMTLIGADCSVNENDMLNILNQNCLYQETIPDEWKPNIESGLIDLANDIYIRYIVDSSIRQTFE